MPSDKLTLALFRASCPVDEQYKDKDGKTKYGFNKVAYERAIVRAAVNPTYSTQRSSSTWSVDDYFRRPTLEERRLFGHPPFTALVPAIRKSPSLETVRPKIGRNMNSAGANSRKMLLDNWKPRMTSSSSAGTGSHGAPAASTPSFGRVSLPNSQGSQTPFVDRRASYSSVQATATGPATTSQAVRDLWKSSGLSGR